MAAQLRVVQGWGQSPIALPSYVGPGRGCPETGTEPHGFPWLSGTPGPEPRCFSWHRGARARVALVPSCAGTEPRSKSQICATQRASSSWASSPANLGGEGQGRVACSGFVGQWQETSPGPANYLVWDLSDPNDAGLERSNFFFLNGLSNLAFILNFVPRFSLDFICVAGQLSPLTPSILSPEKIAFNNIDKSFTTEARVQYSFHNTRHYLYGKDYLTECYFRNVHFQSVVFNVCNSFMFQLLHLFCF